MDRNTTFEKMRMESADMIGKNVEKIAELFPECVTEAADQDGKIRRLVDFEKLREILSGDVAEEPERYDFTWVGKSAALAEAHAPIRKTLRPCPKESRDWDTTQNLYIEGDNLDVLKLLQESYLGQIKMIYIDPPYNTGSDAFIYSDSYKMESKEYESQISLFDEEKNKLFKENNESNPRFHSDWCSMIYSRLVLARNLLRKDGAIFISIDDNELVNLRRICDEVFGEKNFISVLNWNTKKAAQGMTTAHMIVDNHEYVLVYAKESSNFKFYGLDRDETNGFSNPDNDPRGLWKRQYLQRLGQGLPTRTIVDPATGNRFSFETPYTQEKLDQWIVEGRIIFPRDPSKYPARKEFLTEYENRQQLVTSLGLYATKSTTEKLYGLFNNIKIFTNPKPDNLIKFLVEQGAKLEGIVLDFFSGSATTAQAVMELNNQNQNNGDDSLQYILVQLPERCNEKSEAYRAGYKTISDIGKERIRLVGDQLVKNTGLLASSLDVGFRVLKVDSTNMNDVYYGASEVSQDLIKSTESNIKDDRTDLDLLFGCLLDWGVPLSYPYKSEEIDGATVHDYNDGDLIACFAESISEKVVEEIARRKPTRAVFRDSCFETDAAKINVTELFKRYSPDTRIKTI